MHTKHRRRILLALCVVALLLGLCRKKTPTDVPNGLAPVESLKRTARELLDGELSQTAPAVMVCLVLTVNGNITLDKTVRLLNHAYMPTGVQLHLAIVSAAPVVVRRDAWSRGNCSLFRNISLVRFRADLCFVLIQNNADIGPYLLYWMWRSWAARRSDGLLISGDADGTGVIVHAETWVQFVRSARVCGHANVARRYFDYFTRNVANAAVLHPPRIDGYVLIRLEWQSMTEREHEPKLVRVWDERFVREAVMLPSHGHK